MEATFHGNPETSLERIGEEMTLLIKLRRLLRSDDGPTAVEYAVMLALIVGVCVGAVQTLAIATRNNFDSSANAIQDAIN